MAHVITFEYEMFYFPCVQTNVRFEHMQRNTKNAYLSSFTCRFCLHILVTKPFVNQFVHW